MNALILFNARLFVLILFSRLQRDVIDPRVLKSAVLAILGVRLLIEFLSVNFRAKQTTMS